MRLHRIHRIQTLPLDIHKAWDFFSDPANLARITPPWLDFRVTTKRPARMYAGQILTYTVRALPGLDLRWVTEITHVREPSFFVDEQRFGPYRFWHHQHRFRATEGGVEMEDLVHYALPFWPAGEVLRGLVASRLVRIFDFRRDTLSTMFGSP